MRQLLHRLRQVYYQLLLKLLLHVKVSLRWVSYATPPYTAVVSYVQDENSSTVFLTVIVLVRVCVRVHSFLLHDSLPLVGVVQFPVSVGNVCSAPQQQNLEHNYQSLY